MTPNTRSSAPGSGDDPAARQAAADAAASAKAADDRAANAQQMVRNRDATLASLQATADGAQSAMSASAQDRAALHTQLDALASTVAALPKPPVLASGQARTSALLAIGASVDLTVTLSRAMPTDTYSVEILPVSGGLLPGAAAIAVKARTKTTVTLTITATLAVAAASVVSVVVWG